MICVRALLRQGFFGVALAYALLAQALMAGALLSNPVHAMAPELCVIGEAIPLAPDGSSNQQGGHDCPCLAAHPAHASVAGSEPVAFAVPMRAAVPFIYAAALVASPFGSGPESPAARGPPLLLA